MPPYKLSCISLTYQDPNTLLITLTVYDGISFQSFIFPNNKPFNRGQILKFLGQQLDVPPGEIIWPVHIKIPKLG